MIQEQFLVVDGEVQLVLEGDAYRRLSGAALHLVLQVAEGRGVGHALLVAGVELGDDIRLAGHEYLLEHRLRRGERDDRHRVALFEPGGDFLPQRLDVVGPLGLEVEFRLGDGKLPVAVQQELLLPDIGRVLYGRSLDAGEQTGDAIAVLVEVDVLVPFHLHE